MAVHVERLGPSVIQSWAPGRVAFVGDHTDYNFGLSLATTLPRGTWTKVQAQAGVDSFHSVDGRGPAGWETYLKACVRLMRDDGLEVPSVRIDVWGDLPIGRGLSSSASLISSTLASLHELMDIDCPASELALKAQRVENFYLGIPTGSLDQEVIVKSPDHAAMLVDFGNNTTESIALPEATGHRFIVIDPDLPRQLDVDNFGIRRAECANAIASVFSGADRQACLRFRESTWAEILKAAQRVALTDTLLHRLAHVWTENRRVQQFVAALQSADAGALSDLINQSHESLRDDFQVSTAEMETARTAVLKQPGIRAARMVGAGFGGCLLALATDDAVVADYPSFELF